MTSHLGDEEATTITTTNDNNDEPVLLFEESSSIFQRMSLLDGDRDRDQHDDAATNHHTTTTTTTMRQNNGSVFWYSEFWMQKLYQEDNNMESALSLRARDPPRRYVDEASAAKRQKGMQDNAFKDYFFYWAPMDSSGQLPQNPERTTIGYRLFGLTDEYNTTTQKKYSPVVDVKRGGVEHEEYRLYAARDFEFGDAIVFFPEFEEKVGCTSFVLGGMYARMVYLKDSSNAYLCQNNRVLRCLRTIQKGDEIVRWIGEDEQSGHLENIDQVVIDLQGMKMGKIGCEVFEVGSGRMVHYPNGDMEIASPTKHMMFQRNNQSVLPF